MASKSQESYMTAMALIIAECEIFRKTYADKPGRDYIKSKNDQLAEMAGKALLLAYGGLDEKQIKKIGHKIGKMEMAGLDRPKSIREYLSMLIRITADMLVEIPKTSVKYPAIDEINKTLVEMWEYFASKNKRDDMDEAGWKYSEVFNNEFKEAC